MAASVEWLQYHYAESIVFTVPADRAFPIAFCFGKDDSLIYYDPLEECIVKDSGNARKLMLNGGIPHKIDENEENSIWYDIFTTDKEGNIYLIYSVFPAKTRILDIYNQNNELVKKDVPLEDDGMYHSLYDVRYFDGKIFTIDYTKRLNIYSAEDGRLIEHPFSKFLIDGMDIDRSGNLYLTLSAGRKGTFRFVKADINNGFETVFSKPGKDESFLVDCNDDDGLIYLASNRYIDQFDTDGNFVQTVLTFGDDTSFMLGEGAGLEFLASFAVDSKGNIVVSTKGNGQTDQHIYKFTKMSGEKQKEERTKK